MIALGTSYIIMCFSMCLDWLKMWLFSHSLDRASWYTGVIRTNRMHFS